MPYGFLLTWWQPSNDMHKRMDAHLMGKWFGSFGNTLSGGREGKVLKAYKFRIYPNKATANKLQWVLDRCRELYNAALQERKEAYKYAGKTIGVYEQKRDLVEIKQIREEYQEIGSHVLQDVMFRLDKAMQAFFRRVKSGETPGYPRFQGKNRYDSFCYPDRAGWKLDENLLHLTKIGNIKVKLHRPMIGKVKTCTIKREGDHWYVIFACEIEQPLVYHPSQSEIGIDLGLLHFATLSTGEMIENPRHYRRAEKKLKVLQQSLDRKKRGSHRRHKAVQKVAKAHRKVRNQRRDFLQKESRKLVDTHSLIVFEDLQASNLVRRPKPKQDENGVYLPNGASQKSGLNKSIQDAGWNQFVTYCQYKAVDAGTTVLTVNPRYTSQICSGCGTIAKKTLEERWHSCECGCELDRDHNAAINILRVGRTQQLAMAVEAPAL